jgi:hypothetical protein
VVSAQTAAYLTLAVGAWSWAAIYTGAAGRAILGARRRYGAHARDAASPSATGARPAVTLLRPCAGDEPDLARRLASVPRLPTPRGEPARLRVVFAVATELDAALPAIAVARGLLAAAGVATSTETTGAVGPNRKADQLERALARLRPADDDILVFADSDVELAGVDLAALVDPLADRSVGATWAAPVEAGTRDTAGDAWSHAVLSTTLHAFPLLGSLDPSGLVGKLFALRGDAVATAFAPPSLRRSIGEDFALGERLRRAGLRLVLAPVLARSHARGRSPATVRERYRRWLLVVRAQRGSLLLSYPLIIAAGPAFAALAVAALALRSPSLGGAATVGLVVRLVVAFAARRFTGSDLSVGATLVAAARGDALLLGAAARALVQRRITWREHELVVGRGGQLVEEGATP